MGALLGLHEKSFIGDTTEISTSGTSARSQLVADANGDGPARFLVMCDQAVYLKQGGSTVTAASTDLRLIADQPIIITVTDEANSYLAAIQFDTAGTVKATRLDKL